MTASRRDPGLREADVNTTGVIHESAEREGRRWQVRGVLDVEDPSFEIRLDGVSHSRVTDLDVVIVGLAERRHHISTREVDGLDCSARPLETKMAFNDARSPRFELAVVEPATAVVADDAGRGGCGQPCASDDDA
jgi:hypothetical protein